MTTWIIRIALTAALLILVWLNSHWSVATCITLLAVRFEIENITRAMTKGEA